MAFLSGEVSWGIAVTMAFTQLACRGIVVCCATEDSFEQIYSATNPCIYHMVYVLGTLFSIDEYIHRHTHQGNTC